MLPHVLQRFMPFGITLFHHRVGSRSALFTHCLSLNNQHCSPVSALVLNTSVPQNHNGQFRDYGRLYPCCSVFITSILATWRRGEPHASLRPMRKQQIHHDASVRWAMRHGLEGTNMLQLGTAAPPATRFATVRRCGRPVARRSRGGFGFWGALTGKRMA